MKIKLLTILTTLVITSCSEKSTSEEKTRSSVDKKAIVIHYSKIVHATYQDSLKAAQNLRQEIKSFVEEPTADGLQKSKEAWLAARSPYGQSEGFRFYSGPIDDENGPEGLLNAWPLDETYIDSETALKGIIQNTEKFPIINAEILTKLNEKEGEENISTGYHAIEFLLWGIDTSAETAGNRNLTDFTTQKYANRRLTYLTVVTDLLCQHLNDLEAQWKPNEDNYRAGFEKLTTDQALTNILNGIGMLSGFELARERIDVPYNTMSQEDEHSCFSDNTHKDILYNALSVQNVFEGRYNGINYSVADGPSVKDLFANGQGIADTINQSVKHAELLKAPFDQLILAENTAGRESIKTLIDSLVDQAQKLSTESENIDLKINIEE
ncbi:MAG: putative iron-regulated protein [Cryomorphaceae bacterium]|jgi:putative iron-regulated protein